MKNGHFIAELKYKTTDEGGRMTPAKSGIRPSVKFHFDKYTTTGDQEFIDKKWVFPGENVKAKIRILSYEYFAKKLEEGMAFEIREGARITGTGKIIKILDSKLRKCPT